MAAHRRSRNEISHSEFLFDMMREERLMSNLVTALIKEYQRRLVMRQRLRRALGPAEPVIAAPKCKLELRRPETKPHVPTPDHRLRESHL